MIKIVGIRFREGGQIFNFNPGDFALNIGDAVIVDTQNGLELGFVAFMPRSIPEDMLKFPLRDIIRFADDEDLNIRARQETREAEALDIAKDLVAKHELEMQLLSAQELAYDDKLVFYFKADGRVDFRALVKDLATVFRMRIELRQIGVRDEARRTGGIGRCGRVLCCASFLKDFGSVSVKMAKNQNLSMNPSKISGVCGRLLCCLKYEDDAYTDARSRAPELNTIVNTSKGKGEVKSVDLLKETFVIEKSNSDEEVTQIVVQFSELLDEMGNRINVSRNHDGACSCQACCKNKSKDEDDTFSSFDVAKRRVDEWIVEQAGDLETEIRYDFQSEAIIEIPNADSVYYGSEDKVESSLLPSGDSLDDEASVDVSYDKDKSISKRKVSRDGKRAIGSAPRRKHFGAKRKRR